MSLTLTETATTFELPPAGPQAARCSRLIDLGTQTSDYQGEARSARKVLLTWELAEERSDGTPHTVSRRFTASLHEKSALRAFLKSWRGRDFTPEELSAFDLRRLLNAPALLNLVHTERNGREYADIASISPIPKGMQPPPPVAQPVLFDLSDPATHGALGSLSEKLAQQIEAAPEWRTLPAAAPVHQRQQSGGSRSSPPQASPARAAPVHQRQQPAPAAPFEDDEIPF